MITRSFQAAGERTIACLAPTWSRRLPSAAGACTPARQAVNIGDWGQAAAVFCTEQPGNQRICTCWLRSLGGVGPVWLPARGATQAADADGQAAVAHHQAIEPDNIDIPNRHGLLGRTHPRQRRPALSIGARDNAAELDAVKPTAISRRPTIWGGGL